MEKCRKGSNHFLMSFIFAFFADSVFFSVLFDSSFRRFLVDFPGAEVLLLQASVTAAYKKEIIYSKKGKKFLLAKLSICSSNPNKTS